jgi:hypothetical protein
MVGATLRTLLSSRRFAPRLGLLALAASLALAGSAAAAGPQVTEYPAVGERPHYPRAISSGPERA